MAEKVRIQDVARLANVSTGTVSRVLNNKPDVDLETRERILRIVEEQGYIPSITAAGLAAGRNRLISVLVSSLTWPLVSELMSSVATMLEQTAYEIVLYNISEANHERDCRRVINRILATKLTAGLLAIFPGQSVHYLKELQQQGFPVVLIDDQKPPLEGVPWIGADNRGGAREATRYLLQLGHRRIACIQGPMKYKVSHDRYEGYCDALQEAEIKSDISLVKEGDFETAGGRRCAQELFALPPSERPTAVFAGNDLMAFGVISAAQEAGLRIPDDISLVGFDDHPSSIYIQPPLTTVCQPFPEMGKCAIELLLQFIEQARTRPMKYYNSNGHVNPFMLEAIPRIQLPTMLVLRASCQEYP